MFKRSRLCLFLSALLLWVYTPLYAGGLSTTFGELWVEDLKIGEEYSLEETADFPLVVKNTSDEVLQLIVEVLYPKPKELKEGYQSIPDTSWVTLQKKHFELQPGEEAKTDVIIKIPNDKKYLRKKFQVYLWSHTIGRSLGVGLKSRLLFSIASE